MNALAVGPSFKGSASRAPWRRGRGIAGGRGDDDARFRREGARPRIAEAAKIEVASAIERPDAARVRRFEALVMPHMDAAYRLALSLTRQVESAQDVVHDAFLRALTGFDAYRGGDARAWLLTIVRRRAFDWLRDQKRQSTLAISMPFPDDPGRVPYVEPFDPDQKSPEQALIAKGEAVALHALINALAPRLREVLVLREVEDLSYRQIAEITGAPIGSVMSRLARARARLGDAWRRLYDPRAETSRSPAG